MKIDIESARYYAGLGDLVMWAWLSEGAKTAGELLTFYRRRDLGLARLLGLKIDPEPGGLVLDDVFRVEVADRGARPRLSYIQERLALSTPLVRPALRLDPEDESWAEETVHQLALPVVLLFPQSAWKIREWPANYWVDLAWKLKRKGYAVLVMYQGDDLRFKNTPLYYWNTPIPRIAALMKKTALVIGNDSFAAHLAGTVGVPTLALMGPTKKSVFAHIPNVACMTSEMECTGCHFQQPFRAACDQGCMSLYRVFPDAVVESALGLMSA